MRPRCTLCVRWSMPVRPTPENAPRCPALAVSGTEIDIVDRVLAVAVDQIDQAAADPLDRRDVQLHRADLAVHRLGAEPDRPVIGRSRVLDAERDRADRRPVQPRKGLRKALGLGVQDEVDVALLVERDVFRAVPRRRDKPHPLEQRRQLRRARVRCIRQTRTRRCPSGCPTGRGPCRLLLGGLGTAPNPVRTRSPMPHEHDFAAKIPRAACRNIFCSALPSLL